METKVCSICLIEKELSEFNACSRVKSGKRSDCRECQKKSSKEYKLKNKERIKEYNFKWNSENKKYYQEYRKVWEFENPDKVLEKRKRFNQNNPDYYNEYNKERRKVDEIFKLKARLRGCIWSYIKNKSRKTFDIVGCSPEFLKEHLEKQFVNGMSWENRDKWHIDHIIPLSSAKTEEELLKLCHYTNLQPLWAKDNLKKSNKIL